MYPNRRGEGYAYEGFVLRALKSTAYPYRDATNVVGFYAEDIGAPPDLAGLDEDSVTGTVVLDPATEDRVLAGGTAGTIWVFRYYDLVPRALLRYGEGLRRLVQLIESSARRHGEDFAGVDIVAHSMGGLVVREGIVAMESAQAGSAERLVHRVVTLGTPHRGIAFQRAPDWLLRTLPRIEKADDEMASFNPELTKFRDWATAFDLRRVLTVVGTDYRSYGVSTASALNRLSSLLGDGSLVYNRSDGLVKQSSAQLPGAPRTFVHKCHGGRDSLVTSREAYEIAMRFFHGTHRVSLGLMDAEITRGGDWFGRSEFYFGVSIKPRYVDFELFHQSAEAENCYGPFADVHLLDQLPDLATELDKPLAEYGDRTTGWAGPDRLIWEGWFIRPHRARGVVRSRLPYRRLPRRTRRLRRRLLRQRRLPQAVLRPGVPRLPAGDLHTHWRGVPRRTGGLESGPAAPESGAGSPLRDPDGRAGERIPRRVALRGGRNGLRSSFPCGHATGGDVVLLSRPRGRRPRPLLVPAVRMSALGKRRRGRLVPRNTQAGEGDERVIRMSWMVRALPSSSCLGSTDRVGGLAPAGSSPRIRKTVERIGDHPRMLSEPDAIRWYAIRMCRLVHEHRWLATTALPAPPTLEQAWALSDSLRAL